MKIGQPKLSIQGSGLLVTPAYSCVGQIIGTDDLQLPLNPDL
jgi:hypothetical protein